MCRKTKRQPLHSVRARMRFKPKSERANSGCEERLDYARHYKHGVDSARTFIETLREQGHSDE